MSDYTDDYRLLGLAAGCSLQALKAARRRLIKTWHPDRFPNSGDEKRSAEERIKLVNAAFDRLIEHHRAFGSLPSAASAAVKSTPAPNANPKMPTAGSAPHAQRSDPPADRIGVPHEPIDRPRITPARNPIPWLIVFAAIAFLSESIVSDWIRVNRPPSEDTDNSKSITDEHDESLSRLPQSAPSVPDKNFTVGDTIDDVYAVQGPPSIAGRGVWHYGKSKVYFADGSVTAWENNPENPLHVTPPSVSRAQTATENRIFMIGSTKAEVRALQGTPLVETEASWDYGLSKVYFRDGRVVDWESSTTQPLKARK